MSNDYAFPLYFEVPNGDGTFESCIYRGMTLRDYFAAMTLQGMHARNQYDAGQASPYQRTKLAYIEADAMMNAREQ